MITVTTHENILVVDSRLIAQELGVEHHTFLKTLNKYQSLIEQRFGIVRFEVDKLISGAGRPERYALLTEAQATALMTFSRNTDQVVECKLKLVEAFEKAKQVIKEIIPQQSERLRELELQLALTQAETQKAIAEKAILDTRHLIVSVCPEAVQQKILGYKVVTQVEYRDRIIQDDEVLNDGTTVTRTELCKRYGILTKSGAPDFKKLKQLLENCPLPSNAWQLKIRIQDNQELHRDFLDELDRLFWGSNGRQTWLGES